MEVQLRRPPAETSESGVAARHSFCDGRGSSSTLSMTTDVFWIPMWQDRGRRNSLGRRDTWAATTSSKNKLNAKDDKEAEKQHHLQKKVFDLTAQISQLDKRLAALKEENELLKKKGEDQRASDEKIKQLKRRNAELAAIARKLEDRAKQLQQQDPLKKPKDVSPSHETSRNKTLDREKLKTADDKDKVIDSLREKCQELIRLLGSQQKTFVQYSNDSFADSSDLELMLKQAAKERLQLERRLAESQRVDPEIEAKLARLAELEDLYANLENEVSHLSEELQEKEKMEIELVQRKFEIDVLNKELDDVKQRTNDLEKEFNDVLEKNTELAIANSDMQQQISVLETVKSQCDAMELKLKTSESEAATAKSEVTRLSEVVESLEHQLQLMSDENARTEAAKAEALERESLKQKELDALLQVKEKQEAEQQSIIKKLEERLMELEKKCLDHEADKQRMSEELNQVKEHNKELELRFSLQQQGQGQVNEKQIKSNRNLNNNETEPDAANRKVGSSDVISSGENADVIVLLKEDTCNGQGIDQANVSTSAFINDVNVAENGRLTNSGSICSPNNQQSSVRIFVALYDYDPEQSSPNDQPDLEIQLRTGDYVLIYGDMDEDGFYEGELLNGRRGLVPSNFVSQLNDDDAAEVLAMITDESFNGSASLQQMALHDSSANSASLLQVLDTSNEDFDRMSTLSGHLTADPPFSVQIESGPDLGSLIVSWFPVTITSTGASNGLLVKGYNVYVNGQLVKQLLNPTGDHVLLEYEDLCQLDSPQYVTVRTLTMSGMESEDSPKACLSSQMIRDITAELRSVSLHSASETSEIETRLSPVNNTVVRPVPCMPRGHVAQGPRLVNDQRTVDGNRRNDQSVATRSTSEPPEERLSDKDLTSVRANTVPPTLETIALSDVKVTCNTRTVDNDVVMQPDLDDNSSREIGNINQKQLTRSLLTVAKGNSNTNDLDNRQVNGVSRDRGDGFGDREHYRTMPASTKRTINGSAVWNPAPSLLQSGAYSMTALDSANYRADISPSNITIGGGGVWRRVQRRDSGIAAAASVQVIDSGGQHADGVASSRTLTDTRSSTELAHHPVGHVPSLLASSNSGISSSIVKNNASVALNISAVEDDVSMASSHVVSGLVDNNAVTSHHLRDDIPDSELIDYSDDGGESLVDSSMFIGAENVRIFVALFDYDPSTMSPNPDAVDVEIPFREGDIIKVYGDQDADGFYSGECNGLRGLVPSNMVTVFEVDHPDIALQLLRDSCQPALVNGSLTSSRASSRTSEVTTHTMSTYDQQGDGEDSIPADGRVHYVIALYSYNPQELSPNIDADQELAFDRGQIIAVYGDVDDDGFYFGEVNGRCGLVPSNFVQPAPLDFISLQS